MSLEQTQEQTQPRGGDFQNVVDKVKALGAVDRSAIGPLLRSDQVIGPDIKFQPAAKACLLAAEAPILAIKQEHGSTEFFALTTVFVGPPDRRELQEAMIPLRPFMGVGTPPIWKGQLQTSNPALVAALLPGRESNYDAADRNSDLALAAKLHPVRVHTGVRDDSGKSVDVLALNPESGLQLAVFQPKFIEGTDANGRFLAEKPAMECAGLGAVTPAQIVKAAIGAGQMATLWLQTAQGAELLHESAVVSRYQAPDLSQGSVPGRAQVISFPIATTPNQM